MNSSASREKQFSNTIHIAKCFATLSIVSAHIIYGGIDTFSLAILKRFSSVGVIIFFICSAYYFCPDRTNGFLTFARKKVNTIIIPWLAMGSLVYVIYNMSSKSISVSGWIAWLVGYKTYLWFIPILLYILAVFYLFYDRTGFCIGCIGVSVVSLLLTAFSVLDPVIQALHITNYLFLPNWVGVFAIGCLLRKYKGLEKILSIRGRTVTLLAGVYLALLAVAAHIEPDASGYFSKFGLLLELIGATLVLYISGKIECNSFLKTFSGCSYAVYLIHFCGILVVEKLLNFVFVRFEWISLFYFIPVSLLVFALLILGYYMAKLIKVEKLYTLLTGIRIYPKEIR